PCESIRELRFAAPQVIRIRDHRVAAPQDIEHLSRRAQRTNKMTAVQLQDQQESFFFWGLKRKLPYCIHYAWNVRGPGETSNFKRTWGEFFHPGGQPVVSTSDVVVLRLS